MSCRFPRVNTKYDIIMNDRLNITLLPQSFCLYYLSRTVVERTGYHLLGSCFCSLGHQPIQVVDIINSQLSLGFHHIDQTTQGSQAAFTCSSSRIEGYPPPGEHIDVLILLRYLKFSSLLRIVLQPFHYHQ